MLHSTKNILCFFVSLLLCLYVAAQPANDACSGAITISNLNNFCSANGGGTTVGATDDLATGGYAAAGCWGGGAINDVWYKFVATATDVTITINGNQGSPVGGSLLRPQVALYSGTCGGTLTELVCGSAPAAQNIIQIYKGGLTIGQTYYVRVDAVGANKGTFQYCINNYFPVPAPNGDCPTAVVLCDKNNFNVPSVSGAGSNATEMNSAACFQYDPLTGNVETSSTWYVFTFATSGTFTFVITPTNSGDDLDFALFRLPNGVGNCTGKVTTRCMASSCTGPTGLNTTSVDTQEPPDCLAGQDNFVSQVNVTAGQTYALAINNFTSTGNGFNISFGGTAQIQGPVAAINDNDADDQICIGQSITYTDASTAPPSGTLTSWSWNFGTDATPATSTAQNPPSVSYSTPGIKTVTLTVKSDRGCLVTSTKTITVGSTPVSVTAAASANPVCSGTNVTFTATPTNPGATPTYQWYLNGATVGSNSTTYSNAALNNGDQVKVTLTTSGACLTGSPATSNTVTMTINPKPTVTVNSPTICAGNTATLTANGATTYTWTGGLPNGSPVTTPVLNSTTSYTVTGTDANGCKNTATATVTVNPKPTVTVNSPSICAGNTATLTANGATTYTWTGGLPNGSPVTTPVLNSNTSYTVTGTDANGCSNTAVSNVTVNPKPTVTVNSPTICTGSTATLTANGASTYTWTGGLPNGSPVTTPVLNANTSYTVTGTSAAGCSNTAVANVTVNPLPTVGVNSPTICAGQTATLTATGATTYTWTGGLPNGATVTTLVLNSTTSYTVTGTDANGCKNTAVATVTVKPKPTVTVNSPTICAGQTATLTANGATTYTWTGGLPNGSPVTTPVLNSTTSYTVTGTDASGCTNTAIATVTVNPKPNVTVNSPSICTGTSATLTANGATTYTWTGGLPNGSPVTTPVLNSNTSYTVTGTDANGCSNTAVANVTVNPLPTVGVNSPTICAGQTATLTATGATTYTWTGGLPNGATVTTPVLNSTTSYTVTGSNGGCSNTAVSTVTVNPKPTVTVNSPTICAGKTATLTANGASTYIWTGGLPNGSPVTTPVLNSTTNYTVTGTDGNGCTNTATATVTVNPLPNVTVNSPSICDGKTATLNANGATSYTWSSGLPNGSTVTTPVLHANTSYTVTGTDANGCVNTATSNVTVHALPTVTVNSPTICSGKTAILNAGGASTYTWTGGLPNGNTVTTQVLTSNTSYTVTGTDVNGCVNTATSNVTVNPLPTVTVNSPSICAGQTATLNANGASTYTWSGGLPAGASTITPVLNSNTSYVVTGTDANGCQNTATSNITVNPKPPVTVNSPTICQGQTATLNANGANSYTWSGGLPNGATVTTPPLNSNTSYTVTGTDGKGCTNTATSNVTVNPTKTTNINPTICQGESVTVGSQTFSSTGNYTVHLLTSKGCDSTVNVSLTVNPVKSTNISQTICEGQSVVIGGQTFPNTGVYSVKLQSSVGCDSTVILNLTVNPQLTVDVTATPSQNDICAGTSVTFTATPTNGGVAPQYQWYLNGAPVGTNSTTYKNDTLKDGDEVWVQLVSSETCIKINPAVSEKVVMKVYRIDYTKPIIEYCAGETRIIDLNIPQTGYTITWKNGSITTTTSNDDQLEISNTTSGNVQFNVLFGKNNSCQVSDVIPFTVNPVPQIDATVDHDFVKYQEEVQFNVNELKPYDYIWMTTGQLSNDTIKNPTAVITEPTWFVVTATDAKGCRTTDSLFVNMKDECSGDFVFIPNAFTPNRDGINDCFGILYAPPMTEFKLVIFDRWGEKLFETTDINGCWDGSYKGTEALTDSYSYVIGFRCYNGKFISKKGVVTLLH